VFIRVSITSHTVKSNSGTGYTHALASAPRHGDWDGWYRFEAIRHAGNYRWFPGSYLNCSIDFTDPANRGLE
jgi:hypothetical protein